MRERINEAIERIRNARDRICNGLRQRIDHRRQVERAAGQVAKRIRQCGDDIGDRRRHVIDGRGQVRYQRLYRISHLRHDPAEVSRHMRDGIVNVGDGIGHVVHDIRQVVHDLRHRARQRLRDVGHGIGQRVGDVVDGVAGIIDDLRNGIPDAAARPAVSAARQRDDDADAVMPVAPMGAIDAVGAIRAARSIGSAGSRPAGGARRPGRTVVPVMAAGAVASALYQPVAAAAAARRFKRNRRRGGGETLRAESRAGVGRVAVHRHACRAAVHAAGRGRRAGRRIRRANAAMSGRGCAFKESVCRTGRIAAGQHVHLALARRRADSAAGKQRVGLARLQGQVVQVARAEQALRHAVLVFGMEVFGFKLSGRCGKRGIWQQFGRRNRRQRRNELFHVDPHPEKLHLSSGYNLRFNFGLKIIELFQANTDACPEKKRKENALRGLLDP